MSFETKIAEAAKASAENISSAETAAIKQRVRFTGQDPDALTTAEAQAWIDRALPAIRRSHQMVSAHTELAGLDRPQPQNANLFPPSLFKRLAEGGDPYSPSAQLEGEILCSLSDDRCVRFNPKSFVVTPLSEEVLGSFSKKDEDSR